MTGWKKWSTNTDASLDGTHMYTRSLGRSVDTRLQRLNRATLRPPSTLRLPYRATRGSCYPVASVWDYNGDEYKSALFLDAGLIAIQVEPSPLCSSSANNTYAKATERAFATINN